MIKNCLTVNSNRRPDIIDIAKCHVEKILSYTENERIQVAYLEKKLEKKLNKSQK
jgi:hypothetical protein